MENEITTSYADYFSAYEIRSEFQKEYISLFKGWLGKINLHKLDEVTENEWKKFNELISLIHEQHKILVADCSSELLSMPTGLGQLLQTYIESENKESKDFLKIVLPELQCVLTEEWDYTYIIWHKNNGAVERLKPLIETVQLYSWSDRT